MTDGAQIMLALAAHLRDGAALPDAARQHVARAVEKWLAGEVETLEAALGVQPGPGHRRLPTQLARTRRDDLVRQAAARFAEGTSPAAQARWLATHWRRYAGTAWPRERHLTTPPAHRAGTIESIFWQAMKIADATLSERTIRSVLAASCTFSLPGPGDTVEQGEQKRGST